MRQGQGANFPSMHHFPFEYVLHVIITLIWEKRGAVLFQSSQQVRKCTNANATYVDGGITCLHNLGDLFSFVNHPPRFMVKCGRIAGPGQRAEGSCSLLWDEGDR